MASRRFWKTAALYAVIGIPLFNSVSLFLFELLVHGRIRRSIIAEMIAMSAVMCAFIFVIGLAASLLNAKDRFFKK